MKLLTPVLIIAALLGLGWCYYFGPYYIDAYKMKDVAGTAAISWAAFNEEKGHNELGQELKRREIPEYLTVENCSFYERPGDVKVVECTWYVDVYLPFTETARRLSFRVEQSATRDGLLDE